MVRGRGFEPHISIHALREEGDKTRYKSEINQWRFLSTPSARRATSYYDPMLANLGISIHALREEGDDLMKSLCLRLIYFYPRPPRGGRRHRWGQPDSCCRISIHALREEGDP